MGSSAFLLFLSLLLAFPLAAEVITNETIHYARSVWVPCANGGAGEWVSLSGPLHVLTAVTQDQNGGMHVKQHRQPQGLSGIGEVTGDVYHATGGTQSHFNTRPPYPSTETRVNNFRLIAPRTGNNLLAHAIHHVTVNADGTVTSEFDIISLECK
jgi:hypothetical protein